MTWSDYREGKGARQWLTGSTTVVATYVAYLRCKLAGYGPDVIHTQRAVGHSLRLPRPGDHCHEGSTDVP
jgi:hypothetical protein